MDRGRGSRYRGRGRGRANLGERGGQVRDLVTRLNRQLHLETPPDDFRELTVIPTFKDIHTDKEPFLRPNIVRGRYPDVNTYLDVQFRLLREDFVRPLREGILDMRRRGLDQKGKLQDIHVYHDVHVVYPTYSNQGMVHRIQFDSSRLKGMKWGASNVKRLIYGSLVCLTKDEFETMHFATVVNSNRAELEQGWVDVRFKDATFDVLSISPMDTFIMVESSAFFEAYRHVLKGLQEVQENTMPFAKYIVDCDCADGVDPPAYLRGRFGGVRYDLSGVVTKLQSKRKQQLTEVPVLRDDLWPSAKDLGFDESQYRAFKLGLTKEFAVIQGPPGTGKTYIGLKIIEVLLKNSSAWRGLKGGRGTTRKATRPILVVCYTNHALDQFLEGIAESYPEGIVRVGGQSKSEKLERFQLTNIRQKARQDKSVPWHIKKGPANATREMKRLQEEMDEHLDKLTATQSELLHENTLMQMNLMDRRHQASLMQGWQEVGSEKGGSAIVNWLGLGGRALLEADRQDNDAEADEVEEETIDFMDDPEEQRRLLDDDEVMYGRGNKGKRKRKSVSTGLTVDLTDSQLKENLGGWQVKINEKKRRNFLKRQLSKTEMMTYKEARQVQNVWTLQPRDRWRLYRYWLAKYCELHKEPISAYADRYEEVARRLEEFRNEEDRRIMEKATVIGMTTTGAAKYRSILHTIQPAIIIVEEAAEVLEAHIVTTLSQQCQHLILIGDHQQLRPNPTVYQLAKKYNMDISLFERMVNNDMQCVRLKLQHRMRPEFARLLTPHIYESLDNHESVLNFKDIKGVSSNLFFLDHSHVEERAKDTKSRSNMHEAQFLASFCRYLLQQGYSPSQITILTTYSSQLRNFNNVMPRKIFAGVRVCTVDNFQGEESDIILLSLVRSNEENIAGFLKVENRVCVALSRAKKGFYAIGNLTMLAKASKLWTKIREELRQQGSIGSSLTLSCQNHPDSEIPVSTADDFKKTPNGWCMRPCGTMLQCGHVCGLRCHLTDRKHEKYKCQKLCAKVRCDLGHRCQKRCSQKCGKCEVLVEKALPRCHHKQMMPCYETSRLVQCQMPCEKVLSCGHSCKNTCSQKCSVPCMEMVAHQLPCGHTIQAACSAKEDDLVCNTPCRHLLECGHRCSGTCGRCKQGRLHQQCTHHCKRVLSSHQSKAKSTSIKTHVQTEATAGTLLIELNDVQREATAGKLLIELNDVYLLVYCAKSASDLRNQVASCRLPSPNQVAMFEKKTVFLKTLARRKKDKIEHLSVLEDKRHRMELDGEIAKLEAWLIRPTAHVSEQEWEEFGRKVVRLKCLLKLRILQGQIQKKRISLDDQDKVILDYAEGVLTELKPFTKTREELVRKALKTVHGLTLRSPVLMGAVARSVSGSATRRKEPQASVKQSSGPEDGRSVVRCLVRSYEENMQFDY